MAETVMNVNIYSLQDKATSAATRTSQNASVGTYSSGLTENDAFDGIHDDDL